MEARVSTKTVIGEIIRDFGIKETIHVANFVEWIGQAVGKIGYGTYTEIDYVSFEVKDFKIPRPNGMILLNNVFYNGVFVSPKSELKVSVNTTQDVNKYDMQKNLLSVINASIVSEKLTNLSIEEKEIRKETVIHVDNAIAQLTKYTTPLVTSKDYYYEENYNCIETNIPEGFVVLQFTQFLLDADENPFIIDTFKYKEAVKYFVLLRLIMQGYKHVTLTLKDVIMLEEDFMKQARNESKKMTNRQIDRFANNWTNITFNLQKTRV